MFVQNDNFIKNKINVCQKKHAAQFFLLTIKCYLSLKGFNYLLIRYTLQIRKGGARSSYLVTLMLTVKIRLYE